MEIREVADSPEDARSFRDSLKAWKNRGKSSTQDEARAENEGMVAPADAPEPVVVEEDALDRLEDDMVSFEAADAERASKRRSR